MSINRGRVAVVQCNNTFSSSVFNGTAFPSFLFFQLALVQRDWRSEINKRYLDDGRSKVSDTSSRESNNFYLDPIFVSRINYKTFS